MNYPYPTGTPEFAAHLCRVFLAQARNARNAQHRDGTREFWDCMARVERCRKAYVYRKKSNPQRDLFEVAA